MVRRGGDSNSCSPHGEPAFKAKSTGENRIRCIRDIEQYIELRRVSGLSKGWVNDTRCYLSKFLRVVKGDVNQVNTINYLNDIQSKYSTTAYRKQTYQIRKFLLHLDYKWAMELQPPTEPMYIPKRISIEDIQSALAYFKNNEYELQLKTVIYLGAYSGMRAKEIYQLRKNDINLDDRIIYINHKPREGQTTKTKQSRVSFITPKVKELLNDYIEYYNNGCNMKHLFGEKHLHPYFRHCPIKVKDLRKYFSQEWDRRGGPTSIKKILMGHSLKGDVDLMHYNSQSPEDLKKIYDTVMGTKKSVIHT